MHNLYVIAGCNGAGKLTTQGLRTSLICTKELSDNWVFCDNSGKDPFLVAKGQANLVKFVYKS